MTDCLRKVSHESENIVEDELVANDGDRGIPRVQANRPCQSLQPITPKANARLELMLDAIELVADVVVDTAGHRELLCRGEECVSLHFLVRVCNP